MKFRNGILIEGFGLLAEKKSPRYIQDALNAYLDPSIHYDIEKIKSNERQRELRKKDRDAKTSAAS